MDNIEVSEDPVGQPGPVSKFCTRIGQRYQKLLDDVTPHVKWRWVIAIIYNVLFMARIIIGQGWYVVTYALAIYHLNLLLAFLSPKIDPGLAMMYDDEDGPALPTRSTDEFRPFERRLPEFKFWYSVMKATTIAFCFTAFQVFNIPVFWPILVMYFITLFCITMKRQIKHMLRYNYLPFSWGKPKYAAAPTTDTI
ncbi:protein RER1-like [Amphibalanus amphitrite]|uniref:protein RER1-like n=1 Tax=Amphibalanus amphitrite TaxID=1232801 RepID=UPI001C929FA3|nr:protein RER1-like [Amphibalanus amphitrite]XP_043224808.1 protein RER1-like [Amphibalanus amphitrite]XP_043224809.1 protein RER1-like [Amphibalanus amphitrite]XP_043224811.1 protein RER1-like [Amphibalanus amphitrite]XP_043224812.1 protein RER1-like [Amphibalanus amphitrite]